MVAGIPGVGISIVASLVMGLTVPSPNISDAVIVAGPVSPSGNGTTAVTISDPSSRVRSTPGREPMNTRQPSPVAPSAKKQETITDEEVASTAMDSSPVVAVITHRVRSLQNRMDAHL